MPVPAPPYPEQSAARDRWILSRRAPRLPVDPRQPAGFLLEQERAENGEVVPVATILLTNRECPWRCLMCDLWKHTLTETVPPGAIPAQIDFALAQLASGATHEPERDLYHEPPPHPALSPNGGEGARRAGEGVGGIKKRPQLEARTTLKLYNAGSFFDPNAIPPQDYPDIAARAGVFERVIVECHPALVGERVLRFQEMLRNGAKATRLEIAMGLETVHPEILSRLNKRMTLDQFAQAATFLRAHDIAVRAFILVKPPFLDDAEALVWAQRSMDFAFDCGAGVACLIPVRAGNGALEALARRGEFSPPRLATLEAALDHEIQLHRGRVFADTWNLEELSACPACFPARTARLREMNLRQQPLPRIRCRECNDAQ